MIGRAPRNAPSGPIGRDAGGTLRCRAQPQLASLPPRVETIDTRSPEVAPLWAELSERGSALGLDGAYFLIVPSFEPGGARVAAAASARIRPLLETYRAGRNPEINVAIRSGFAGSEPNVWRPDALMAELPLPLRRARQAWMERVAEEWGVCLHHGFDVPVFAAGGWRGLFKINAPEGPITAALMREVHEADRALPSRLRADQAAAHVATDRAGGRRPAAHRRGAVLQERPPTRSASAPRRRRRRSSVPG